MIKKYPSIAVLAACALIAACDQGNSAQADKEAAPAESPPPVAAPKNTKGLTQEQRLSDASMIVGLMERGYAPRQWKEKSLGVSFSKNSGTFMKRAGEDISDAEFYEAIAKFMASFHDSHISYRFPSTYRAELPFMAGFIEGRIIALGDCQEDGCDIKTGDELVAIDGKAAIEVRDELKAFIGEGNPLKEIGLATLYLTYRTQAMFPVIPEGDVVVTVKSRADGKEHDVKLKWKTKGYPMQPIGRKTQMQSKAATAPGGPKDNILDDARMRLHPRAAELERLGSGSQLPFVPLGANFIERKKEPYYSGVMIHDGKRIGFLRIHTYHLDDYSAALAELEEEISYFEDTTDAMIIDQTGNTGGDWCYTLDVASFFFQSPQKETRDQWKANHDTLVRMESLSLDGEANANDRALASSIATGIRNAMKRGDSLTEPFPECSMSGVFRPHTTRDGIQITYTKPILLLIDEWAVSCGDYFPAIMKDSGRATLFGMSTSGGGGTIRNVDERIGYSEVKLSYTISMGWREPELTFGEGIKTHYIENVGVSPDIEYAITLDDFLGGYAQYASAMEQAVLSLVDQAQEKESK